MSSFSNSADNSANDADFEDENMWGDIHKSALFPYRRPGSRAISLPTRLGLGRLLLLLLLLFMLLLAKSGKV